MAVDDGMQQAILDAYLARDYGTALEALLPLALGSGSAVDMVALAAQCAVGLRRFDHLSTLIAIAEQKGAPPPVFVPRVLLQCLEHDMLEALVALGALVPDGNLIFPITLYYASCAHLVAGREDAAMAGFNRFRLALPAYRGLLPLVEDGYINLILRQGSLVLPPEETAARIAEAAGLSEAQTGFRMIRPFAAEGVAPDAPVFLCCADARYVGYFLKPWAVALGRLAARLHVHVINPAEATPQTIEAAAMALPQGVTLSASASDDAAFATATAFACGRFFIIPRVQEALGRPVLALDIDVEAQPGTAELAVRAAEAGADFACFETGRREPASVHQASIMYFARSDLAMRFLQALGAFCRPKLAQSSAFTWMLDQAALFSVLRLFARRVPEFRYVALDRLTGRPLAAFIRGIASDAEKNTMRLEALFTPEQVKAQAEGAFTLDWQP